ncbi:hypothetical protein K469DRAFT_327809 [Zopfia rhizophila CBS 207.26]|uniref:Uncharacterized protein n=1 Tax=Zopfia rhizophila CBS 207.26 TaxID=1314779 RepID=A0A6A6DG70_9PEZI|nr:hypothetical protein K469DRAFT_327809 [Zopfia rhizophila CBS 207.26]
MCQKGKRLTTKTNGDVYIIEIDMFIVYFKSILPRKEGKPNARRTIVRQTDSTVLSAAITVSTRKGTENRATDARAGAKGITMKCGRTSTSHTERSTLRHQIPISLTGPLILLLPPTVSDKRSTPAAGCRSALSAARVCHCFFGVHFPSSERQSVWISAREYHTYVIS